VSAPSVIISCNPTLVAYGDSSTVSWNSSNASSCTKSGDWSGSATPNVAGSQSTGALNQVKTYTYTLGCDGNGSDSNSCTVDVTAPPPTTSSITITEPDYCISGPAVTVSWTYADLAGSTQGAYQVQISDSGNFNNPILDTGKINSSSNAYFTGQGILQFNTTYKARVRTWSGYDAVSNWSNASNSWKTPLYAYPQVDFSWTANGILNNPSPPLTKPVQFTDLTTFSGNPNGRQWDWTFGDGGTSTTQNPTHTYSTEGSYYVTLTATDNANQVCVRTKGPLIIQKPIPRWREVAPK
jgi:PKD repeat protein